MNEIHVHVHGACGVGDRDTILAAIGEVSGKVEQAMGKIDEMRAELAQANQTTNESAAVLDEISADVESLKSRLEGGLSAEEAAEVQQKLTDLNASLAAQKTTLQGVAAQYTPPAAPENPEG